MRGRSVAGRQRGRRPCSAGLLVVASTLVLLPLGQAGCEDEVDGGGGGSVAPDAGPDPDAGGDAGRADLGDRADSGRPPGDAGGEQPDGAAVDTGGEQPDAAAVDDGGGQPDAGLGCSVSGRLSDLEGAPVSGVRLVLCDDHHCYTAQSGADGRWSISDVIPAPLALKVLADGVGRASFTVPGVHCEQGSVELGELRLVPLPDEGLEVDSQQPASVQLLPELLLHLPPGLLFPSFELTEPVRAAAVPLQHVPQRLIGDRLQPLAVFALSPYGTEAPEPVAFEVRLEGVAAGEPLDVWALEHGTGVLQRVLSAAVSDEAGWLRSGPGQGPTALTWLLIAPHDAAASPGEE